MLAVGEAVADALPTCGSRDNPRDGNSQAQQNAETEKYQLNDAECALHGG